MMKERPRLLDLFCGAGGAAVGYHRSGFDVVGVDNRPQKHYPFEFHLADAMTFPLNGFDAIHASPPCQGYSAASIVHRNRGKTYPLLIDPLKEKLNRLNVPYVIENVIGSSLKGIVLCGTMFGLGVFRHRIFESNVLLLQPKHLPHDGKIGDGKYFSPVGGSGRWKCWGRIERGVSKGTAEQWRKAMGIDWMTRDEIRQAVPPAYTEFIGRELIGFVVDFADYRKRRA